MRFAKVLSSTLFPPLVVAGVAAGSLSAYAQNSSSAVSAGVESLDSAQKDDEAVTGLSTDSVAKGKAADPHTEQERDPSLPEGMTLEETLARAAVAPPPTFPKALHDDRMLAFFLADQFEYRLDGSGDPGVLGWEADAWFGWDYSRLWLKPEGEATFHSPGSFESETDALYSRLIAPFWSAQVGIQYANAWQSGESYTDRWSAALALQGLAPGRFEVDTSLYLSEDADLSATMELEYDWRVTQRLVVQPRTELGFAMQDIPERNLGAGLADVVAGIRVRYEIEREFAPYIGLRYEGRVFESADRTRDAGESAWRVFALAGIRFALL